MKLNGHGKSSLLTEEDRQNIHKHLSVKYQVLFDIMWYSSARLSEALQVRWIDIAENTIVFRKSTTKGAMDTREVPVPYELIHRISKLPNEGAYIFCGRNGKGHLTRFAADKAYRSACKAAGVIGYSTHSYRRSLISSLSANQVPIKVIMKISGHKSMTSISHYIDIDETQVLSALKTRW